ncbi:MAG: hypothetical protein K2P03_10900 [Lachnospiraceae bacterium]|nr:hypothetical protein [Lachnospiraceae bacterium]
MTYEEYLTKLEQIILKKLHKGEDIRKIQVLKNNNLQLDGFSYRVPGHREQPTVYVNQYYEENILDEKIDHIAELVLHTLRTCKLFSTQEVMEVLDFEQMKSRIYYRLISREKNRALLEQIPWLPWLDLAIVFYLRIPEYMIDNATALIRTEHLDYWKIEQKELYEAAAINMAGTAVLFEPMEHFLERYGLETLTSGMYVLTNKRKEYGAAAIVDPKVQRMCALKLQGDYCVLPSSIHELIVFPKSLAFDKEELNLLVQEVNASCVREEDYLSGHAYFYSSETQTLC